MPRNAHHGVSSGCAGVLRAQRWLPETAAPDALGIAGTFDVAVDYLVIPDAPRRPLHAPANALADQLAAFATLPPDDQAALLKILDPLVTKTKLRALTTDAS